MRKPELLAPAGNLEKGKAAVRFGADAIYLGGNQFNLRAKAGNFSLPELEEMLAFSHSHNRKVYVTVNIIPHNDDLDALPAYMKSLQDVGVDAAIVADPSVIAIAQEVAPELELHLSTQASMTNWRSAIFWAKLGIKRIVLARELSLHEIAEIREKTDAELEVFIHGAMCISYSGRCLLSNYMANRDANKGECVQACRFKYYLVEEKRPGEYMPVDEDERGTYIMNSKDLCLLGHIPQLVGGGVDSFKIEGRMKSLHYVATVTQVYRQAIDAFMENPGNYKVRSLWWDELRKISHRPYSTGFLLGKPGAAGQYYGDSRYQREYDFSGVVESTDGNCLLVEARDSLHVGEEIEILVPGADAVKFTIESMTLQKNNDVLAEAHPNWKVSIWVPDEVFQAVKPGSLLRKPRAESANE